MRQNNSILLDGKWQLYYHPEEKTAPDSPEKLAAYDGECIPACVPGNVELDMIKAGKLPSEKELYFGDNIMQLLSFEHYQWWYVREFETPDFIPDELIFKGLDCLAEIFLNGEKIGSTDNAMIPHTFNVSLRPAGEKNILAVRIRSAALWARNCDRAGCLYGNNYNFDSLHIRKPGHAFGKDINPRVLSAGIWKSVILRKRPETEILNPAMYAMAINPDGSTLLRVVAEFRSDLLDISGFSAEITGVCGDSRFQYNIARLANKMIDTMNFPFQSPRLWWPKGYGEQPLYEVNIRLFNHGQEIARNTFRAGIRHIKLEYSAFNTPEHPGKFQLLINGRKIFVKGTNWIWMNLFHSRDPELLEPRLKLLEETGCNMVRMHGSNVYEEHDIYDFCDEKGIMIWQDFGMTGMGYPFLSEELWKNMKREFSWFISEYARHSSITVWSGDNEADVAKISWLAMEPVDPGSNRITRELLPCLLATLDLNSRPFMPSSPFIDADAFRRKMESGIPVYDGLSDQHIYSENYYKDQYYLENIACFSSEIGFWSLNSADLIRSVIPEEFHNKPRGNRYWNMHGTTSLPIREGATIRAVLNSLILTEKCFGSVPEDLDPMCDASQIAQAEAFKFVMENYRMRKPQCSGLLWWNLFDSWPQCASCAVTDNNLTPKISWFYLKRLHDQLLFFIDEELNITASNDSFEEFEGTLQVRQFYAPEKVIEIPYHIPADCVVRIGKVDTPASAELFMLAWNGGCNHYHYETRPFDLERYRKEFLPAIMALKPLA